MITVECDVAGRYGYSHIWTHHYDCLSTEAKITLVLIATNTVVIENMMDCYVAV
jgi:hypothetical protein